MDAEGVVVDIILGKETLPMIWLGDKRVSWEVLSLRMGPEVMEALSARINFLFLPDDLCEN